jgi:hypothetical protein
VFWGGWLPAAAADVRKYEFLKKQVEKTGIGQRNLGGRNGGMA